MFRFWVYLTVGELVLLVGVLFSLFLFVVFVLGCYVVMFALVGWVF